ncbi:protein kinase [Halobacterium sp. R2-5]|uniref:protein kinase n=1 Tax=Halobacterium sp. R2-5 TaxID=2715751 RepID=UPI001422CA78|nr:protein kinase [Halobacterium sp. R2-5]NIB99333.1 protein kinase [Halobacterium sp. R2-5]
MERDTDGPVDGERVAALRQSVDADGVDELAERLDSDDPDERAGAAWRLVEAATTEPTRVRAVLDDVLDATEDPDLWVRRGATWALAELAERQPDALSVQFSELVDLTRAEDSLVQQNGVVAVAGVTKSFPARATSGLSAIAPLTQSGDALVQRYAKQAVREVTAAIAERAEDAGYPMVVRAHPEYAGLFPDGVSVVEVNGDDDRTRPVYVSFGEDAPVRTDDVENDEPDAGPPEEVPKPPGVTLAEGDLAPDLKLREGLLTTDYRADVDEDVLEHGLATVRRLHAEESAVAAAFADAVEQWASVDDHDHVVTVLGYGARWLATRYDDGDTLDRRGAPPTLAEAVWDVDRLTRAVSYTHSRGVVHGGIYPDAVRFVETGPRTWAAPVLGDWGFAHAASARQTPPIPEGFAAPEHRDPETYGRFDQATDVYGLGALAYFLLTGEPPGDGDSRVPASEQNPALPEAADALFRRAMAPEKRVRFATVLDFQRAFDDFAADLDGVSG